MGRVEAALAGDAQRFRAPGNLLCLRDGEEFAAGEKGEAFALAVRFAEGEGDLAFGVAVPEGKAAELLAIADTGLPCVASLLHAMDDAGAVEGGGVEAQVEGPGGLVAEGNALPEAGAHDRDGVAVEGEGPELGDGGWVDETSRGAKDAIGSERLGAFGAKGEHEVGKGVAAGALAMDFGGEPEGDDSAAEVRLLVGEEIGGGQLLELGVGGVDLRGEQVIANGVVQAGQVPRPGEEACAFENGILVEAGEAFAEPGDLLGISDRAEAGGVPLVERFVREEGGGVVSEGCAVREEEVGDVGEAAAAAAGVGIVVGGDDDGVEGDGGVVPELALRDEDTLGRVGKALRGEVPLAVEGEEDGTAFDG